MTTKAWAAMASYKTGFKLDWERATIYVSYYTHVRLAFSVL